MVSLLRKDCLIRIARKPKVLRRRLYPWQLRARAYASKVRHPALFMRMRLGKTPVSIRTIVKYTPRNPRVGLRVLVVAPNAALGGWEKELRAEGERSYTYLEGDRSTRLVRLCEDKRWFFLNNGGWIALPEVAGVETCSACGGRGKTNKLHDEDVMWFDDELGDPGGRVDVTNVTGKTVTIMRERDGWDDFEEIEVPLRYKCPICLSRGWTPIQNPPVRWDAVVLDESTSVKNPKARITRFFLENFRDVPHRWILTGEPRPESDLDLWSQFAFLDGQAFGHDSYWGWRNAEFHPREGGWGWILNPDRTQRLDEAVATRAFVCDHADAGIVIDRVRERRELELPKQLREAYRTAEREFVLEWDGKEIDRTMYAVARWQWLRQMCGGFVNGKLVWDGKIKELIYLLKTELKREHVLVWFAYNQEIGAVARYLRKEKVGYEVITGKVGKGVRRALVERFTRGDVRVLLIQGKVDKGMQGAALDAADTNIYYSNHPDQEIRTQSEDRIVHIGKTQPLLYVDMTVKKSVDDDLADLLVDKRTRTDASMARAVIERMRNRILLERIGGGE